jgi:hypothetical protein
MTLAVLVPSRGRPDNLKRFINAVQDTAEDSFVFTRLDDNDPALQQYKEMFRTSPLNNFHVTYGERVGLAESINELAAIAVEKGYSHVSMFGDDVLPITPGWDTALIEGLGGKLGVAYGDDGLRDKHAPDLATHYVTQVEVYLRLGYLAPPGFKHLFIDNVMGEVGLFLDNLVYVPVELRHLHPWAEGEGLHDQTYAEGGRNHALGAADKHAFINWLGRSDWKEALS